MTLISAPLFDYPKIDVNPRVPLLGVLNHPWVNVVHSQRAREWPRANPSLAVETTF